VRVPINGAELEVEVLGDPGAPVLIAHHGAPGIGSLSEPKASFGALADTHRVIVFDARGSGQSSDTPPYTHAQWVADVDALREWAGVEQIVMAGGSYGGFVALEYALAHPDRVKALVLRDTAAADTFRGTARERALNTDRTTIDMELFDRSFTGQVRDNAALRLRLRPRCGRGQGRGAQLPLRDAQLRLLHQPARLRPDRPAR
jgi:proline iminopeptidase